MSKPKDNKNAKDSQYMLARKVGRPISEAELYQIEECRFVTDYSLRSLHEVVVVFSHAITVLQAEEFLPPSFHITLYNLPPLDFFCSEEYCIPPSDNESQ